MRRRKRFAIATDHLTIGGSGQIVRSYYKVPRSNPTSTAWALSEAGATTYSSYSAAARVADRIQAQHQNRLRVIEVRA